MTRPNWIVCAAGVLLPTGASAVSFTSQISPALFYLAAMPFLLVVIVVAVPIVLIRMRWLEVGTPNPQKIVLPQSDFRSIWDIAHSWAGEARGEYATEGKHPIYCFTYRGAHFSGAVGNSAWYEAVKRAELGNFRFHDLRHTWASWHHQSGTSTDELKDLGGWKSRVMVDRYAKFATEHLAVAASRIESGLSRISAANVLRFPYGGERKLG